MANWIKEAAMGASIAAAIPKIKKIKLFELLSSLFLFPPQKVILKKKSAAMEITPAKTTTAVINNISLFLMCDNSWAITPSISVFSSFPNNPLVTAKTACFSSLPVAKALGWASFKIYI
jgi:hypothetical protein